MNNITVIIIHCNSMSYVWQNAYLGFKWSCVLFLMNSWYIYVVASSLAQVFILYCKVQ